jgi:hypothetical protein
MICRGVALYVVNIYPSLLCLEKSHQNSWSLSILLELPILVLRAPIPLLVYVASNLPHVLNRAAVLPWKDSSGVNLSMILSFHVSMLLVVLVEIMVVNLTASRRPRLSLSGLILSPGED